MSEKITPKRNPKQSTMDDYKVGFDEDAGVYS